MKKNILIETYESISYSEEKEIYQIPISGWDLKNQKELIKELMEEFFDYKLKDVEILDSREVAYSCSRYDCGQDANDDGYSFYINYIKKWKKGLGKCTRFSVKFVLDKEKEE